MPTSHNFRPSSWFRRHDEPLFAILIICYCLLSITGLYWSRSLPVHLQDSPENRKGDRVSVIYVFEGTLLDYQKRCSTAATIAQEHPQAQILLSTSHLIGYWSKPHQRNLRYDEWARQWLEEKGITPNRIVFLPHSIPYTHGELLSLSNYLKEHKIEHAHLVTSDYHALRVSLLASKLLPPSTFSIRPAPSTSDPLRHLQNHLMTGFLEIVGFNSYRTFLESPYILKAAGRSPTNP